MRNEKKFTSTSQVLSSYFSFFYLMFCIHLKHDYFDSFSSLSSFWFFFYSQKIVQSPQEFHPSSFQSQLICFHSLALDIFLQQKSKK